MEATGLDRLIEAAAEADERLFHTPVQRLEDWRRRWAGLRSWLAPPGPEQLSEADRLSDATIAAIGDVLALLRRVTEARRGGVSRESQLRHLAAWFTHTGTQEAAHALFDVVFGLGAPRHVGVAHPDPEAIASRLSWWRHRRWSCPAPSWPRVGRPGRVGDGLLGWTGSTTAGTGCAVTSSLGSAGWPTRRGRWLPRGH